MTGYNLNHIWKPNGCRCIGRKCLVFVGSETCSTDRNQKGTTEKIILVKNPSTSCSQNVFFIPPVPNVFYKINQFCC